MQTVSDDYRVNFATKVFVDEIVSINQRFGAISEHNYDADVVNLDFGNARSSAKTINDWVKETTNGNIKDLVSEEAVSKSIILLINALYFEGKWRFAFNKSITRDFYTAPNKKVAKQFMEQNGNFYYFFSRHLNAKILRLPYEGRKFSMFIILPQDVNGIDSVIDKLDANAIKNEVWHMDELETRVILPKFKFDTSIALNEVTRSVSFVDCHTFFLKFILFLFNFL